MRRRCLTTAVAARRKMKIMKPFLDVLGLISASLLVRSHYRKMPILACLKSKNRSKSPFSIGLVFSIVSESTSLSYYYYTLMLILSKMVTLPYTTA